MNELCDKCMTDEDRERLICQKCKNYEVNCEKTEDPKPTQPKDTKNVSKCMYCGEEHDDSYECWEERDYWRERSYEWFPVD